jgi:RHS repeat-associated protein
VESYDYDRQSCLILYTDDIMTATYGYDALDRRIAKTVDGVTEAFIYDSMDLGDSTASNITLTFRAGQLVKRWLFGPQVDEPLAFEAYTSTTAPGTGSVIELLANRLGSIITALSVSTGAVAAEYDYDSFGTRTQTGTLGQPYGFTGREHDDESGLMHYSARVYDPVAGVFLQSDPIGFASKQANTFAYSGNNPANGTDPSGLSVLSLRQVNDASAQFKGAVLTNVSSGVMGLAAVIADRLLQSYWSGHRLSPLDLPGVGPTTGGGSKHCNSYSNETGQHVYMIYTRNDGIPRKVGIANNKRLTADGYHSSRALEQIVDHKKYSHVVVFKTPDGIFSRFQAILLEQAVTNFVAAFFGPGVLDLHTFPEPEEICP